MVTILDRMKADQGRVQTRTLHLLLRSGGCWTDVWAGDLWLATGPTRESALAAARDALEGLMVDVRGLLGEED